MDLKTFKKIYVLFYLILLCGFGLFIYLGDLSHFVSIDFLLSNRSNLIDLKKEFFFEIGIFFFLFSIFWHFFLGFGSPLVILSGFLFNTFSGTIILLIGKTIGATLLFAFVNRYFKNDVKKYFRENRPIYKKTMRKIIKHELTILIFIRFLPVPVQINDLAPVLINAKTTNYFLGKFIGSFVPHLIIINIVNNFFKYYSEGDILNINLFFSHPLFTSILIGIFLLIFLYFIKNKILKNSKKL